MFADAGVDGQYVWVESGAQVGIIGDGAQIGALNAVTPRRVPAFPMVVGGAPPLASAYQARGAVLDALAPEHRGGPARRVLSGSGGVGKTQIAAGQFHHSDAALRVWVAADSRATVLSAYADAALRLDLADREEGTEELAKQFIEFLATSEHPWLVVLDDLRDPAHVTGLWPEGAGRVLVTTRRRDAAMTAGGRTLVQVGVYSPEEASGYLHERLASAGGDLVVDAVSGADELAEALGCLPLALAQAAAVMINDAISAETYQQRFADRRQTLAALFPKDADADGYTRTVATTWQLAMDAADRLNPARLASAMGALVAALDSAGIPETVLTGEAVCRLLAARTGRDQVSGEEARGALRALHRLSLAEHRPDPADARAVRMHNLTGRAILTDLSCDDFTTTTRAAASALHEAWPAIEKNTVLAESLRANTQTLLELSSETLVTVEDGAHRVLFRCGMSLSRAGLAQSAISYWIKLAALFEGRLGHDHFDTAGAFHHLAGAYAAAGDVARAIPQYEQNLADLVRARGTEHNDTRVARHDLASAYEAAGDLARAIPLFEQTAAEMDQLFGPENRDTLIAHHNLAGAYHSAGDLRRAIPLLEQTATDMEKVLGPDNEQTLVARHNLAAAHLADGDLTRAIPLFEQAVSDNVRVLGPDHRASMASRISLADSYGSSGDLSRAIHLHEEVVNDCDRVLGPDHPQSLTARNNLALAVRSSGELARAIPLLEQAHDDCVRALGRDHPHTVTAQFNLAGAYDLAGDDARAIPLYEKAVTDWERVFGPDHPDTMAARADFAAACFSARDFIRAIPLFEQILADQERLSGAEHPDTLTALQNLAGVRFLAEDFAGAIPLFDQLLTNQIRVLGPDHPDTLATRSYLAGAATLAERQTAEPGRARRGRRGRKHRRR